MAKRSLSSAKSAAPGQSASFQGVIHGPIKPSYEQIVDRAKKVWEDKGCPSGRDEEIWLEAERQLSEESRGY